MDYVTVCHTVVASYGMSGYLAAGVAVLLTWNMLRAIIFYNPKAPPHVPSPLPWLGNIVAFGERPVDFLLENLEKYGPVFSFTMFGTDVTYVVGSEASSAFWSSHNDILNAEDLYKNITVPVFGPGVAFDVPNKVFSEQKSIAKEGLTKARFVKYTAMIEEECINYLNDKWGDEGELDLHVAMAEMIVFTATRCLHGKETREVFNAEEVAEIYSDLDGGFSPQAWLFPPWMPFPSFAKRDKAHIAIKERFKEVVRKREAAPAGTEYHDLLSTFMSCNYRRVNDQRKWNDDEISGLLIALLMAGQHTSSTTSSWFGFFMCENKGLQDKLFDEQIKARGGLDEEAKPLTIDLLSEMPMLHACVRETLRLRPPIMQLMRKVRQSLTIKAGGKEYVIPAGNQVCASPSANGRNPNEWKDAGKFDPARFIDTDGNCGDGHDYLGPDGERTEKKTNVYKWVPFGAGRHRCIGFEFAQIQVRCVWATMLRMFELELPGGKMPTVNYRTMIHTPTDPQIKYRRRKPRGFPAPNPTKSAGHFTGS